MGATMAKHFRIRSEDQQITRMAIVMQERQAASGACTENDLHAEGFTTEDIAEFGERAAQKAKNEFVRRV